MKHVWSSGRTKYHWPAIHEVEGSNPVMASISLEYGCAWRGGSPMTTSDPEMDLKLAHYIHTPNSAQQFHGYVKLVVRVQLSSLNREKYYRMLITMPELKRKTCQCPNFVQMFY